MKYAVPVILLLDAENIEEANDKAAELQDLINKGRAYNGAMALLDERLPTFAYDDEQHEVHSALDWEEVAIPEKSEKLRP